VSFPPEVVSALIVFIAGAVSSAMSLYYTKLRRLDRKVLAITTAVLWMVERHNPPPPDHIIELLTDTIRDGNNG